MPEDTARDGLSAEFVRTLRTFQFEEQKPRVRRQMSEGWGGIGEGLSSCGGVNEAGTPPTPMPIPASHSPVRRTPRDRAAAALGDIQVALTALETAAADLDHVGVDRAVHRLRTAADHACNIVVKVPR